MKKLDLNRQEKEVVDHALRFWYEEGRKDRCSKKRGTSIHD
ncbi:hypothetical protein [Sphingobacterium sp. T2]|nr:hypothetical protein [Sphingobacterium sp. T2]